MVQFCRKMILSCYVRHVVKHTNLENKPTSGRHIISAGMEVNATKSYLVISQKRRESFHI
jgi:hypothetical protein